MKHNKIISLLLLTVMLLLSAAGCGTGAGEATVAPTTEAAQNREPVEYLQCIRPAALGSLYPASGSQAVITLADYDAERTTVQLVDVDRDAVCREIALDGIWELREQSFNDGRFALYSRGTGTWKFLSASLEEMGEWNSGNTDGFFSYDCSTYYCLSDGAFCVRSVNGGEGGNAGLPLDLRVLELTAFDAKSGTLAMQFFLSPYGSECGTAVFDMQAGAFTMLQKDRCRVSFRDSGVCLLSFDNDKLSYSVTYGQDERFFFADAGVFSGTVSDMFAIQNSPYLMGITADGSVLYAAEDGISSCRLSDYGIEGVVLSTCYLPDEKVIIGTVCLDGAYRICVIDPSQLSFTETAASTPVASPLAVDEALAEEYRGTGADMPVPETLQEARQYADRLEEKYGVKILLSSHCREAAEQCELRITLTDTMSAEDELSGISSMLAALDRTLALYPKGFPAQFRNGAGDGGLCFLLVEHIESIYDSVGCAYERGKWQYIAVDVRQTSEAAGIICHELWHTTENRILALDPSAMPIKEWDALNPDGFSYDKYANAVEQPWTLYSCAPEQIRFVDSYACVDRHEDRARVMEFFMTHDDEALMLIQSPYMRRKLQILSDAVRQTFDTAGWTNVRWERLL